MSIYPRANSVPLPPPDAERYNTVCRYCNVGCGYHVYVWPNGTEGGPKPEQNAFAADFTVQQPMLTGIAYTESMHATIRRNDGRDYHVAIVPAKDSPINLLGNHSSRGGSNARTTWSDSRPTQARLHYPLLRVGDDFNPIPWDAAIELQARVLKGILDKYGSDQLAAKIFDHGGGGGGMENTYGTGRLLFTGLQMVYTGIHNRPASSSETFGTRDRGLHELNYTAQDARLAEPSCSGALTATKPRPCSSKRISSRTSRTRRRTRRRATMPRASRWRPRGWWWSIRGPRRRSMRRARKVPRCCTSGRSSAPTIC